MMFRDPDDADDQKLMPLLGLSEESASDEAGRSIEVSREIETPDPERRFLTWFGMAEDKEIWEIASLLTAKYGAHAVALARTRARMRAAADDLSSFIVWHAVKEAAEELLRPAPMRDEWVV